MRAREETKADRRRLNNAFAVSQTVTVGQGPGISKHNENIT
jgi:hypothetical protein